ncbi:PH domain-containing protein [Thalassotalea sp. PP2-459]|uniref:PH domain-containing protein n=1 Tax=Thalassotalea sp. PP2-459 TaxID=1742724 RepID=UPI000944BDBC|nr:PH domain-containing protein [Thalassotalea sp. PP2-459]OKY28055.1 helicase [Thalassotalea sp. PP2-459]
MGFLSGLMGNASQVDVNELAEELSPILANNETIELGFKLIRDKFIFTSDRLILIDKQGLTGSKVEYHSVPYKAITHFKIESAGHFDLDSDLKIYISGHDTPITRELRKGDDIVAIQKTLANCLFAR